jgi:hypothetical protein
MSELEIAKASSPVYAYTFAALVAGTVTTSNVQATIDASSLVNFYIQTSKVVGIVRTTAGGVTGKPYLNNLGAVINSAATGYNPQLQLRSSVVTDTSVYTMYWVNEVASSDNVSVFNC